MASACEIVVCSESEAHANTCAQAAVKEVHRIEAKYSRYIAESVVGRINANAGIRPVACDDETCKLLEFADSLYRTSGGLFDITAGVLNQAWDFKAQQIPSDGEIAEALKLVGWHAVERSGSTIKLPKAGIQLDFGGFGKEYAADRAAQVLLELGVSHGYVNLAGDMAFVGPKPDGSPWTIGIQHPRQTGAVIATMPMVAGGLASSGDYERYFEAGGVRYCHILRPDTGRPVSYWQSISVIAPSAATAGAYSTTAMLMESEALNFLESSGLNYLAIDQQGRPYHSNASRVSAEKLNHANH
jgi:thiamine biosynthesis lipoprotein